MLGAELLDVGDVGVEDDSITDEVVEEFIVVVVDVFIVVFLSETSLSLHK